MTPQQFTEWRERLGLKKSEAADALGLSKNMPTRYEYGRAEVPRYIALACSAIAQGLPPYGDVHTVKPPHLK